ncbi:DUF6232 family protein [Paraburkholderia sp. BL21I4N1]|uniref:DUF6232 family protein n=1 Tax=Paraburkholderia sp. BL21I4N1 TaxID=1938801 RepID=UPI000CFCC098|nr:DUF6232 family protein [Paraburkholderia sp. BL21I4N1]PQV51004.1 hypothetical protein B0G83_105367 [Paraburkholderia sp. BL21I4N1]
MDVDPIVSGRTSSSNSETVFLNLDNVKVTNARFVVPGQTFAMSGITSIGHREKGSSRTGGIALALLAAVVALAWPALRPLAALMFVAGIIWTVRARGRYDVILHTAAGEVPAFSSSDSAIVQQVVAALNEAIIFRG